MNVLEKILEEIEEATFQEDAPTYIGDMAVDGYVRMGRVEEIIRSHMGGATDTDDTEEKIREHIAECLHRIDNIRSFIGSKEYTSNDEKCIRNIEVLKTSITALEEYLSSKKKNGNDGWIPVSEKLPEVGKMVKITVHSSEWIGDYYSDWVPEEEKTYHPEERNVYDGYIDRVGMWKFYDEEGSFNACDKEFGTNKEIVYDVVTAWMPKEQIEPYKEV